MCMVRIEGKRLPRYDNLVLVVAQANEHEVRSPATILTALALSTPTPSPLSFANASSRYPSAKCS